MATLGDYSVSTSTTYSIVYTPVSTNSASNLQINMVTYFLIDTVQIQFPLDNFPVKPTSVSCTSVGNPESGFTSSTPTCDMTFTPTSFSIVVSNLDTTATSYTFTVNK
jgi:hypothetical protein